MRMQQTTSVLTAMGGRRTTKETECKRKQVEEKNRLSVGRKAGKADRLWCRKLQHEFPLLITDMMLLIF